MKHLSRRHIVVTDAHISHVASSQTGVDVCWVNYCQTATSICCRVVQSANQYNKQGRSSTCSFFFWGGGARVSEGFRSLEKFRRLYVQICSFWDKPSIQSLIFHPICRNALTKNFIWGARPLTGGPCPPWLPLRTAPVSREQRRRDRGLSETRAAAGVHAASGSSCYCVSPAPSETHGLVTWSTDQHCQQDENDLQHNINYWQLHSTMQCTIYMKRLGKTLIPVL